jgi:hypothetical protein
MAKLTRIARREEIISRTTANPKIRELAQRLLAHEATADDPSEATMLPVMRVSEKLRRALSTLAGGSGFRSLLTRALSLAKVEAPVLSAVRIKPDGSLEDLNLLGDDHPAAEAGVILIAKFLGLLIVFIGQSLTLKFVRDIWPDFPVADTEPLEKNDHERAR